MRAILAAIVASVSATVGLAADDPPPTLDSKLPEGAIARLGAPAQHLRNEVHAIACSPDGKRIAVSIGLHVQILDAVTGAEIKLLSKPDMRSLIREVRFTADGKWLACQAMGDNQSPTVALLWNVDEGRESERLFKGERVLIALSRDCKFGATLCRETIANAVRYHFHLWDALSGAELRAIPMDGLDGIRSVRFTNDGKRLIVQQEKEGWKTLELDKKRWSDEWKEPATTGSIYAYRFLSPDGGIFIHGHTEGPGSRSFWTGHDSATGKPIPHLHDRPGVFIGFDGDGTRYLECAACYDHSLLNPLPELPGIFGLKRSLSGAFGILCLRATATAAILQRWIVPVDSIRAIAFSTDGKSLLIGHSSFLRKLELRPSDDALRVGWWKYRSGELAFGNDGKTLFVWEYEGRSRTCCDPVRAMVTGHLRDHDPLDAGTLRRRVAMIQLPADKLEQIPADKRRPPENRWVYSSPDGKYLLALSQVQSGYSPGSGMVHYGPGQPVELWQAHPLKKIVASANFGPPYAFKPKGNVEHIMGRVGPRADVIGFSPDSRLCAWSDDAGTTHIWEIPSGRKLPPLRTEGATGVGAFSRDRRLIAVGDKSIQVFEIATGSVRLKLGDNLSPVSGIAISPDGTRLASSHSDTSTLIWKLDGRRDRGLTEEGWNRCWRCLGDAHAATAYAAMQQMMCNAETVLRLQTKLLTLTVPDPQPRIRTLIEQMNDDAFRVRRDAELELLRIGQPALPALVDAAKSSSANLAMRSRKLIEAIKANFPTPPVERMRALRGVEILERLGTADARATLRELAIHAKDSEIRRDANEAAERSNR